MNMCYWTSQGRQTLTEDKIQCRHSIGVHRKCSIWSQTFDLTPNWI